MMLLDISIVPEDPEMNQVANLGTNVTDSPVFIIGVLLVILVVALFLRRMLFDNAAKEYKYNPED